MMDYVWAVITFWSGFVACLFLMKYLKVKSSNDKPVHKQFIYHAISSEYKSLDGISRSQRIVSPVAKKKRAHISKPASKLNSGVPIIQSAEESFPVPEEVLEMETQASTSPLPSPIIPPLSLSPFMRQESAPDEITHISLGDDSDPSLKESESSPTILSKQAPVSPKRKLKLKKPKKRSHSFLTNSVVSRSQTNSDLSALVGEDSSANSSPVGSLSFDAATTASFESTSPSLTSSGSLLEKVKSKKNLSMLKKKICKSTHKRSQSVDIVGPNIDLTTISDPSPKPRSSSRRTSFTPNPIMKTEDDKEKEGWARVRLMSVTEKRALWTKRYLVIRPGELFVYKNDEKLDCIQYLLLNNSKIKVLKTKEDRCDLMLLIENHLPYRGKEGYGNPNLSSSSSSATTTTTTTTVTGMDISIATTNNNNNNNSTTNSTTTTTTGNTSGSKPMLKIVLSFREQVDSWMSTLEYCSHRWVANKAGHRGPSNSSNISSSSGLTRSDTVTYPPNSLLDSVRDSSLSFSSSSMLQYLDHSIDNSSPHSLTSNANINTNSSSSSNMNSGSAKLPLQASSSPEMLPSRSSLSSSLPRSFGQREKDSRRHRKEELQWDMVLSARFPKVPLTADVMTQSVYFFHPEQVMWVPRLIKLEMGILHFYQVTDHKLTLQAMVYLGGCYTTIITNTTSNINMHSLSATSNNNSSGSASNNNNNNNNHVNSVYHNNNNNNNNNNNGNKKNNKKNNKSSSSSGGGSNVNMSDIEQLNSALPAITSGTANNFDGDVLLKISKTPASSSKKTGTGSADGLFSQFSPAGSRLPDCFPVRSLDIQFDSPETLIQWTQAIQHAIKLNVAPLESLVPLTKQQAQAMYECDYQFLSSQLVVDLPSNFNENMGHLESTAWLNTLLSRYFIDIQTSEEFLDAAFHYLKQKLDEIRRPDFVGPLNIVGLDFSTLTFQFSKVQAVRGADDPLRVVGEFDFWSEGTIEMEISTNLNLNILQTTLATISISCYFTLSNMQGKMHFHHPPQLNSRLELFFAQIPNYEIDIDIRFTEKKLPLANTIPLLKQYFIDTLRNAIRERIVYPNKVTLHLPFAGRPLDVRVEQVDNFSSQAPSYSRLEAFKEAISRFIDEVLQLGKEEVITEIFTKDCAVTGFSPFQKEVHGHQGVKEIMYQLQQALPIISFELNDVVEKDDRISFHWKAAGRMIGQFWGRYDPSDQDFTLEGVMSCVCKYVANRLTFKAKLRRVDIYWDTETTYRIFSLPSCTDSNSPSFEPFALHEN